MDVRRTTRVRRLAAGGFAALAVLAVPACATDGNAPQDAEDVADVRGEDDLADPFSGAYDAEFREDMSAYAGQEVTLSASVAEVLSAEAFTITAADGQQVDPALVVAGQPVAVEPGQEVTVAATPVEDFDVAAVEARTDVDLDDERFSEWDGATFLSADVVETAGG